MLFSKRFWPGIADGSVTLTFRRWKRPQATSGKVYRTAAGRILVEDLRVVTASDIDDADAVRAGYVSRDALLADLRGHEGAPLYRVAFRLAGGADPREELAARDAFSQNECDEISRRLDRLDRASKHGPWTRSTLRAIAEHPERRAADLAAMLGRDKEALKLDIRKLKNLGLTLSLDVGYRVSPRGAAYLANTQAR